jgi:hypothetical protein
MSPLVGSQGGEGRPRTRRLGRDGARASRRGSPDGGGTASGPRRPPRPPLPPRRLSGGADAVLPGEREGGKGAGGRRGPKTAAASQTPSPSGRSPPLPARPAPPGTRGGAVRGRVRGSMAKRALTWRPGGKRKVFVSSRGRRRFALPPPDERKTAGRGRRACPLPVWTPPHTLPSLSRAARVVHPLRVGRFNTTQKCAAPHKACWPPRRASQVRAGQGRSGERTNCVCRGNRWQGQGGGTGPPRGGGRGPDSRTQRRPPPSSLLSRPRTPAPPPALTPCGLNLVARRDQP